MEEFIFKPNHVIKAIEQVKTNGEDWLYREYPKPNGRMRKSSSGFLIYRGLTYPLKPLGRLSNALAGSPMIGNPSTKKFREYFETQGFQLIDTPEIEAEDAVERQKCLANVWGRPGQAKFRSEVFKIFGACCIVTGCQTLKSLEAAHILPVSDGGRDEGWNGFPLRADIHRLFDSNVISLNPKTWKLNVLESAREDYGEYHHLDLKPVMLKSNNIQQLTMVLQKRFSLIT